MMPTNHMTRIEWLSFIHNQLPDVERERYEDHLYICDDCLAVFMDCLAETERPDTICNPDPVLSHKSAPAKPFYQHTLFHYGVAASITIILMSTGVFSQLIHQSNAWSLFTGEKQQRSVTDQLMQKTTALLDQLRPSAKGGTFDE